MLYIATSLSKIVYYFTKPKKYFSYFLGKGAGSPATQISFEKNLSSVLDKFKIIYINKPEEMNMAHNLIDRNKDTFIDVNS